jgi:Signal transduction histidine kinase
MFVSIKTRLTLILCGILLSVFTIQMLANFLLADVYYINHKTKLLKSVYSQIEKDINTSDETLPSIIRNLEVDKNIDFFLADKDMNLVYTNRIQPPNRMIDKPNPFYFDFDLYPKSDYHLNEPRIIKSNFQDGDRIRLLSKLKDQDTVYYIAICISVKSISEEMSGTNRFILYTSGIAVLLGMLIVYFISSRLVKPIKEINKVALRIANLDFSVRAKESKRKDELESLAMTINNMSDRLRYNISHLQEANKKLEEDYCYISRINEERRELIANISHDLKTPLSILTGYSEMLSHDIAGIDKSFYYETIQDEACKMDVLIKNLLDLSTLENRLENRKQISFNMAAFVEKIYQKHSIIIREKGIICELYCESCKEVIADPFYLELALDNYLSNAIHYTDPGHKMIICVKADQEETVVSVYNEGSNIDESHLDKIWNRFYRVDPSRTRTAQNNIGMGLFTVKTIINAHHGKYGVEDKENGVEFWFSLP